MPKSTFVAYLLWLIGGWFGLHHFYLGRDRQAFVWWCTWGGFCVGWIRDLWRIPHYVQAANEAYEYMEWLTSKLRNNEKPQFNIARWTGQLGFGIFCGYLVLCAIPETLSPNLITILQYFVVPPGIATGVYLVGNIGDETGSFKWTVFGAYGTLIILREPTAIALVTIASSIFFLRTKKYKRKLEQKGFCRRISKLTFAGVIIICLWSSNLYYNASVVTSDGETVYVREAVHHFLESTFWKELKATLYELIHIGWQVGWRGMYEAFVEAVDPQGESNALKALNLTKGVQREEISRRCRKLSRDWHPDKHKKEKDKAQEMFIKVQDACKILLDIHKKREP